MIKNQIDIFRTALMFYTRVPVGKIKGYSSEMLNKSTRFFPLIGIIVGGFGALVFFGANMILPLSVAVLLSMAATVLFTGAFHEDGFADSCDGLGGGFTVEKILEIMKDSRIGTYGATGLLLMLLLKFFTMSEFEAYQLPLIIIAGHSFSRVFPVIMIYTSKYVRLDLSSKVKPIGQADSIPSFVFAVVIGIIPLFFLPWKSVLIAIGVLLLLLFFFRRYLIRKMGGYTGDILGALQQLSELFFYFSMLATQNILV